MSDELAEGSRKLIERALREEPLLPSAGVEGIRRKVLAVGAGAVVGAGIGKAAAAGGGAASALLGPALKGIALGVLVSGSVHFGQRVFQARERAPSPVAVNTAPLTIAAGTPDTRAVLNDTASVAASAVPSAAPPAEIASSSAPSVRPAAAAASSASVATPPRSLSEEIAVLDRVQQALNAGDGAAALRVLDESAAALGHGSLRQERLAAEVLAACAAGDVARARRAASLFLAENSGTPAALRVRASCAGDQNRPLR